MNMREIALGFDSATMPVEACWAYEVAIQDQEADLDTYLNLVAIYSIANDFGYASAHRLPQPFVDAAFHRALRVLDMARENFGDHPEIQSWRMHLRGQVIGEAAPDDAYRAWADAGSALAMLLRYVASDGTEYVRDVTELFARAKSGGTERERYVASFDPTRRGCRDPKVKR